MTIETRETLALEGGAPVRSSFLPYHQPLVDADDERAVLETLRSGWLTTGPRTKAFEKDAGRLHRRRALRRGELVHRGAAPGARSGRRRPRRRGDHVADHVRVDRQRHRAPRGASGVRRRRAGHAQHRRGRDRGARSRRGPRRIIPVDFAGHPCDLDDDHGDRRAATGCRSSRTRRTRSAPSTRAAASAASPT